MVKIPSLENIFLIQLFTSFVMLGIVLVSQFVTYPTYQILTQDQIVSFQFQYLIKTMVLYGPIMILEMLTAIQLVRKIHNHDLHSSFRTNITILGIIWGITFFFESPSHIIILISGYNSTAYRTIIYGNLIRLLLWMIKCRVLVKITSHMFKGEEIYHQEFL